MMAAMMAMVVAQSICITRDMRWEPREAVALRLPDGTPWGSVQGSNCVGAGAPTAWMTFTTDGGTTVEAEHYGVKLNAVVRDVRVFLRAAQDFGGGFTSSIATPLQVKRVLEDGGVELVPAPRTDVLPLLEWKPVTAACDRLRLDGDQSSSGLSSATLTHEARLWDRIGGRETFVLPRGTRLEVHRALHGATQVDALLGDGSKIAGWLKEQIAAESFGTMDGAFNTAICCRAQQPPPRDCTNELPLFVTDGKHLGEVGVMQAGTLFDVQSTDGDWVTLTPRELFFGLGRGWRLVVRSEDLERCSATR